MIRPSALERPEEPASPDPQCAGPGPVGRTLPDSGSGQGSGPAGPRIVGLDMARGLSTLVVVVGHLLAATHTALPSPLPNFTHGMILLTNLAVEVFFALSGFFLGGSLLRKSERPAGEVLPSYALHRITRTWPAYFMLLFILLLLDAGLRGQWRAHWSYFFFLQNFVDGAERFYAVTWTLSIEEWSYILLPLLALGFPRLLARRGYTGAHAVLLGAAAIIVLSLLARLLAAVAWHPQFDMGLRKQLPLRMDALMFGLCIAYCRFRWPHVYRALGSVPVMALVAVVAVAHMGLQQADLLFERRAVDPAHYLFHGTIGITLTCAVAALVLPFMDMNRHFYRCMERLPAVSSLLLTSAKYSYSLYLVHLPIFEWLRSVYNAHTPAAPRITWLAWIAVPILMAVGLLFTACAAWVLYHCAEKPGMDLRKYFFRRRPQ